MKNEMFVLILSVLLILLFSPIVFSQDTVMRIEHSSVIPSDVEDIYSVNIIIENGQNVAGCEVWLTYNPTVLKYADFGKGRFFPDDAFYAEMHLDKLSSTETRLRFAVVTSPLSQHNGDGTIITLYFKVLEVTTSYLLNLVEGDLSSKTGTFLSDAAGNLLPPHVDDHGNTRANATPLSLGVDGALSAVIKPNSDVDYFEVKISGPGELRLYTFLGRDVVIELQDSTGSVLANDDIEYGPIENSRLRHNVNDGIYYIKVTGTTENSTENFYILRANFTPESDDHGNTWADATPLLLDTSLPGVIETASDIDYFRVEVPSRGELTLYTTGDLDTFGELERNTDNELTVDNNSGSGSNFHIHHDVIPQTYYVRVTASSNMIGSYTIHASFTPKVEELPDLVVESVSVSKTLLAPGETFTLTATLKNRGVGRADAPIYYRWHRSTHSDFHNMGGSDRVYTRASEEIGEKEKAVTVIPGLKQDKDVALTANQSSKQSIVLAAPEPSDTYYPYIYYYHVCIDSIATESDKNNNCSSDVKISDVKITVLPDFTGDGSIDENDFLIVVSQFGLNSAPATTGDTIEDITDATVKDIYRDYEVSGVIHDTSIAVKTHADLNTDGTVDFADIELIAKALEDAGVLAAPNIVPLTPDTVQQWLAEAKQMRRDDPAFFDGIAALEQFHTRLPPLATALLSNYPNPFNPETWIPYHLAKPADVRLTIYDINGHIVRALDVGHRRAGRYQDRARAAYWDGRNTHGEPVASGVYFYMLSAGDFTATRRMLIRK